MSKTAILAVLMSIVSVCKMQTQELVVVVELRAIHAIPLSLSGQSAFPLSPLFAPSMIGNGHRIERHHCTTSLL